MLSSFVPSYLSANNGQIFNIIKHRLHYLSTCLKNLYFVQFNLIQVRYAKAEFCQPIIHRERVYKRELGGGGLLDIGVYVIQWALLAFKEKPDKIVAVGNLHESGQYFFSFFVLIHYIESHDNCWIKVDLFLWIIILFE